MPVQLYFSFYNISLTLKEALCYQDRPEIIELLGVNENCITCQSLFNVQLMSEDGLRYNRLIIASMIKDFGSRTKFLERNFDNTLKRHLCYRNFVAFTNGGQPMGRHNRVVIPRCVVNKIRVKYPDENEFYTGFSDPVKTP